MKVSDLFRSLHSLLTERRFIIFTLSLIFVLFLAVLYLSKGFTGGAESMWNYTYARYAFSHPQIFFNGISKPFFCVVSAPFSLLGFKGIQIFNIILGILAGYFSYLVAMELKMKQPILAIILCCFTPIFAFNMFSALTEILFALASIIATYLFIKKRYIFAAIVVSILPLIRFEGLFLIPIYAIFIIYKKQYKPLFYMLSGIIIYYIIGCIVKGSILWPANFAPFKGETGVYGTGSFFQFIKRSPGFFGIPNEIFYITGLVAGITLYLRNKKELSQEFLLIFLPFITYFFVHSFMWWSGYGNSQGSNRYMAAIVPLMAVMSTRGLTLFSLMFEIIFKRGWVKTAALYIGIISVIHIPFVVQNYPISIDEYNRLVKQTSEYIKQNGLDKNKIYYKDSNLPHTLGINPYDESRMVYIDNSLDKMEKGSILIYDEKFFPIYKMDFDSIVQNHSFELQKVFEPEKNFKIYGRDYRIAIFKKITPDSAVLNQNRMVAYGSKDEFKTLASFDFDRTFYQPDSAFIRFDDKNDTKCLKIDSTKSEYLFEEFDLSTLSFEKPLELYLTVKINSVSSKQKPLLFVAEVDKNEKQIYYNEVELTSKDTVLNSWSGLSYRLKLPNEVSFSGKLKLYFLNKSRGLYLLDDYQIGYCIKR